MIELEKETTVLCIEDCDEHFEATQRAFRKSAKRVRVERCADGNDALDYLYRRGRFADSAESPRPSIILMDLNLPGTDGREILRTLKDDEDFRLTPVVVLTSSSNPVDVAGCYRSGATGYLVKTMGLEKFNQMISDLCAYWFRTSQLPNSVLLP